MTFQLSPQLVFKGFDANGIPLVGGLLYSYQAGTSIPQVTYQSSTGPANTNPVVLNARGECALWLDPTLNYKFNLTDALGNQIQGWPVDNIQGQLDFGLPFPTNTSMGNGPPYVTGAQSGTAGSPTTNAQPMLSFTKYFN
jgi:hypothetical protein